MKPVPQIECWVSYQRPSGGIDCRTVILAGDTPANDLIDAAITALCKQHEVYAVPITSVRVRSNFHKSLDYVVRPNLREHYRKAA